MEVTVKLTRNKADEKARQTLGKMVVLNDSTEVFNCFTLELPWKGNINNKSCIPTGEYDCIKVPATAAIPYEHILILNVPDREGCCIHIANYYTQIRGCIAVGDAHVDINKDGDLDVRNSKNTFEALMKLLPKKFKLIIN